MVQEERKKQTPEGNKGMDVGPVIPSLSPLPSSADALGGPLVTRTTRSMRPSGLHFLSVGNKI